MMKMDAHEHAYCYLCPELSKFSPKPATIGRYDDEVLEIEVNGSVIAQYSPCGEEIKFLACSSNPKINTIVDKVAARIQQAFPHKIVSMKRHIREDLPGMELL